VKIRRVALESGGPAHYVFEDVSETDLQIIYRGFEPTLPYYDIPELALFSKDIRDSLREAVDDLFVRYQ